MAPLTGAFFAIANVHLQLDAVTSTVLSSWAPSGVLDKALPLGSNKIVALDDVVIIPLWGEIVPKLKSTTVRRKWTNREFHADKGWVHGS